MRKKEGNKKQAIFDATLRLITERGFHATPTSRIAKEAGIAAGTLYLYFKSKDELLNQLYFEVKRKLAVSLAEGRSENLTISEQIELLWRNMLNHLLSHPIEFAFMAQFENSPLLNQATLEASSDVFEPVLALISKGRQQKVIKDLSQDLMTVLFVSPMIYFAKQHVRQGTVPSKQTIATLYQGCWDAIKA